MDNVTEKGKGGAKKGVMSELSDLMASLKNKKGTARSKPRSLSIGTISKEERARRNARNYMSSASRKINGGRKGRSCKR